MAGELLAACEELVPTAKLARLSYAANGGFLCARGDRATLKAAGEELGGRPGALRRPGRRLSLVRPHMWSMGRKALRRDRAPHYHPAP